MYESKTYTPTNATHQNTVDVLQFIGQEEGRIRPLTNSSNQISGYAYDYFIKDHLGNIRMVLSDEVKQDLYPAATMETVSAPVEEALYTNVSNTREDKPNGYPADPYTGQQPNAKVAKVRGNGQKAGPGIMLKVMAGDHFNLRVSSWYKTWGAAPGPATGFLNDLLTMLGYGVEHTVGGKATALQL